MSNESKGQDSSKEKLNQPYRPYIVGIGASAGGLEALRELLSTLEYNNKLTYIITQHLSPTHTSMLKSLLSKECKLNVVDLKENQLPEPNAIYITPPNTDIEIRGGVVRMVSPKPGIGPKPSVDHFFSTLAEDQGEYAIGIILSGTGADGARGLLSIKSAGGTTFVQDPGTAKYDGMPKAAIQTNSADLVLPPGKMGEALASFISAGAVNTQRNYDEIDNAYDQIIALTRDVTGFNLAQYKHSTIERRIHRRMALYHQTTMKEYLNYLLEHKEEAEHFAKDVLISVTEFFRDTEAFEALGKEIEKMVETAPAHQALRAWVPGCATGEEAFSVGILFEEAIRKTGKRKNYQVFATDIDASATARARAARYPEAAFVNMDQQIVERYFDRVGGELIASKGLREHIVFSVHNLVQDPPFSRVDLISCRNLLIYFTAPLQKRVLEIFHYALNPNSLLFLGKSETVSQHEDLFDIVTKGSRIYKKIGDRRIYRPFSLPNEYQSSPTTNMPTKRHTEIDPITYSVNQAIQQAYGPVSVVITANDEIIHGVGDISRFLHFNSGPVGLNVYELIEESLRAELRALVYKCRREPAAVFGGRHTLGDGQQIRVAVRPLEASNTSLLLISFEPISAGIAPLPATAPEEADQTNPVIVELEHELATTREHLQTVVEELETSNEELQSVNEELQSSNEELQSTNEELQTSNEELQSTNEELLTLNDELQVKTRELENIAADLQNIQDSVSVPLIVIDEKLRVTRFSPSIDQLVPANEIHQGDSITQLSWNFDIEKLRSKINKVMKTKKTLEEFVQFEERCYLMSIMPYFRRDGVVAGAIMLFANITDIKNAQEELAASEQRLHSLVDNIVDGIIAIDERGQIESFSKASEQIFGYTAEEVIGKNVVLLMPEDHAKQHDKHLQYYLETGKAKGLGKQRELVGKHKNGKVFPLELSVSETLLGNKRIYTALARDLTQRKQDDARIFHERERALVTLHSIADGVITTNNEGQVEFINQVAVDLTGVDAESAIKMPLSKIFDIYDQHSREPKFNPALSVLRSGNVVGTANETLLKSRDGREYNIEHNAAPIKNKEGQIIGAVVVFRDVTERYNILNQMSWQARHDSLTGLINRKEMEDRLEHALTSAKSFNREHALLFIDLDQFKVVNDTCGHQAGDELLRQIAGHVSANLRTRDTLSRLGGDEFGVLLENCSIPQAQQLAESIKETVEDFRFIWEDKLFKVGASIGVVAITKDSNNLAQILSDADAACYAAKDAGRNRVQVHSSEDKSLAIRRREMRWVANINQYLDDNRFRLFFQRIQPLSSNAPLHWEVLLRLEDDNNKLVLPGVFIPALERYGLMQKIDRWVLRTTLNTLNNLSPSAKRKQPKVAINISGSSLSDEGFSEYVIQQFQQIPISPTQICFEITETAAIANYAKAKDFISNMKQLGCKFALDDFGSGMSSFGYLKSLKVDYIKIDGTFVKNLNHDMIDLAMVESINRIGQIMDIDTIAEFVENEETMKKLKQIGVGYAQGFGIQKPIPADEFVSTL